MRKATLEDADQVLVASKKIGLALASLISKEGYQHDDNFPIALVLAAGEVAAAHLAYNGMGLKPGGPDALFQAFRCGFESATEAAHKIADRILEEQGESRNQSDVH